MAVHGVANDAVERLADKRPGPQRSQDPGARLTLAASTSARGSQ